MLMIGSFVHNSFQTRVVAHAGAAENFLAQVRALACERPLIITGRELSRTPLLSAAISGLAGPGIAHASGVPSHSSMELVSRLVVQAREHGADCSVAIGGGSVVDTAKAVAVCLAEGEPLAEHASRQTQEGTFFTPALLRPKLPIVAIPTTPSGSEMTAAFGVRDGEGHKLLFWDAKVASRVVLLDAAAGMDVDAQVLLASGMNGLAHCIEALYSKNTSPLAAAAALSGVQHFMEALPEVAHAPRALTARQRLLVAGHLGGAALASAGSCLHHAICHVLGARTGASHGGLNAVVLPHAIGFNRDAAGESLAPLEARHGEVVLMLRKLQARIGIATRLRDLGVSRDILASASHQVMRERGMANNPRTVNGASEIEELLVAAW